jgi:hypothetical protein
LINGDFTAGLGDFGEYFKAPPRVALQKAIRMMRAAYESP